MKLNFNDFLDELFEALKDKKLDLSNLFCDHIAYRASSKDEYDKLLEEFGKIGKMVHEALVNDRRVSIFELFSPVNYKQYKIPALELIEPKTGQIVKSGLEHAEFVISSFEEFMSQNQRTDWNTQEIDRKEFPHLKLQLSEDLQVKFHPQGILEMVK